MSLYFGPHIIGTGQILSITGANPAAGAEISVTVPVGRRWHVLAMRADLTTDVTAVNRQVSIVLDDGANNLYQPYAQSVQVQSTTEFYDFTATVQFRGVVQNTHLIAIPGMLLMAAGFRIRTFTDNFQAGDDWTAPQLLVEEWFED